MVITSPVDNTSVLGTISVNVDASDNNSISDVKLYVDGNYYSIDTSFPYSFTLDISALSLGYHVVKATATDSSENSANDEIVINVMSDTVSPSVQITSPFDGQVISNPFDVLVDASDNMQITRIEFYVDDILKGQDSTFPYSISLNPSDLGFGTHQIRAIAVDGNNNTAEDTVSINVLVDTISPSVNITSPSDGKAVSGKTLITISAFDSSGISKIEIYVDGNLVTILTTSPYEYMWNTRSLSFGVHTVMVKAFDINGNSATDSIDVISEKGGKSQTK
ncbi:MAG: Ig-like domain-containing protein [Nitrosarchaeum sp.]